MTAVDRPDNGQDEGRKYLAGLRQHSTNPTLLRAVADVEAELDSTSARPGVGEQQREQVARWLFNQRMPERYWDNPSFELEREAARGMADELLALLSPHTDQTPATCSDRHHDPDRALTMWCEQVPGHVGPHVNHRTYW